MVSWKEPIERRVVAATDVRGVVIVSSLAYGDGAGGIPGLLLGSPRDDVGKRNLDSAVLHKAGPSTSESASTRAPPGSRTISTRSAPPEGL